MLQLDDRAVDQAHRDLGARAGDFMKEVERRTGWYPGKYAHQAASSVASGVGALERRLFAEHRDVSFVNRPFELERADEHFARMRLWGFTFLRLLVTWEAVERGGPGVYDEAYLTYMAAVVECAAKYDIRVYVDPHQDVYSRFSGGDGGCRRGGRR